MAQMKNKAAAWLISVICGVAQAPRGEPFAIHHLHFSGSDLQQFYAGLFDPATTSPEPVAGHRALRSGLMLLLFGLAPSDSLPKTAAQAPSAIWHVGWGAVSLGETYLAHAAHEVQWEPPLPAARLHLHLVSAAPAVAAAWYRDNLGARVEMLPDADSGSRVPAVRPEHRVAEAIVSFGQFALAIHRTGERIVSTRGQRVDHVALSCANLAGTLERLRARGVTVLQPLATFGDARAAFIEGPDQIAIEIIEGLAAQE